MLAFGLLTNYTWMQENSQHLLSGNVKAFGSGLQGWFSFALSPRAPTSHQKRVVNLLRLTPVFVPDVYLVCKKCFYLVSKYVWAHRVMMLLYWSGRETMAKGYKCWPPLSPRTPLSLLHSQPPLLCFIQAFTHRHAWPNVSMHTNMHSISHGFTLLCKGTHTRTHTHAWTLLSHLHPLWSFWLLFVSSVCRVTRTFLSRPLGSVHPAGTDWDPTQPSTPTAQSCLNEITIQIIYNNSICYN